MSDEREPTDRTPLKDKVAGEVRKIRSPSDFVFFYRNVCGFFGRTVLFIISVALGSILPIIMIVIGSIYLDQCPVERHIPLYLLVGGAFGVIRTAVAAINKIRMRKMLASDGQVEPVLPPTDALHITDGVLSLFLVVWFILGSYWVFRTAFPETVDPNSANYCHPTVYYFAFALLIFTYIMLVLSITCCCCLLGAVCCVSCCAVTFGVASAIEERTDTSATTPQPTQEVSGV